MYDMTMELRADGGKRLYEQIYEHIRDEIKGGKLLAGERLPSTRTLAEYLQVSRSTVDFAYEQLLSEGYIESRPCKGYFVCALEELPEAAVAIATTGQAAPQMDSPKTRTADMPIKYDFPPTDLT